jgi:hypothetical protein
MPGCSPASRQACDNARQDSPRRWSTSAGAANFDSTTSTATSVVAWLVRRQSPRSRASALAHMVHRSGRGGTRSLIPTAIEADAVEVGYWSRETSKSLCDTQPALQVRGSSATNHCHAAPAQPTHEYQSNDRRCSFHLGRALLFVPLDKPFHIRLMQSCLGHPERRSRDLRISARNHSQRLLYDRDC